MSKKIYIIAATLALATFAVSLNFTNNTERSYSPRDSHIFDQAVGRYDIALAYNRLIKGDENGEISMKDVYQSRKKVRNMDRNSKAGAQNLLWEPIGPKNIGGRTRAICVDKTNTNNVMAGAVGGGVYVSTNRGNTWWPKLMDENNLIAHIVQGANGAFYVGTGPSLDDWFGTVRGTNHASDNTIGVGIYRANGIYEDWEHILVVDDQDNQVFNRITHMAAHPTDPNVLFVGTFSGGLRVTRNATAANPIFENVNGIQAARVVDVDITPDGNTVIAISGSTNGNGAVWRSTDGGQNFVQDTVLSGTARIECAIAPSDGNIIYLSAVEGGGCLNSILQSNDGGDTWYRIASAGSQGNQSTFDPFANPGVNCQGNYDNAIAVYPDDPGHILVGGVQLWEGRQQPNSNPPLFGWSMVATTNGGPLSPLSVYVHADKHRIVIPDANTVYIGSDGGVAKSTDGGFRYSQNNVNYQTTQFYSLAITPQYSPYEFAMGGTQDNGTILVGFPLPITGDNPEFGVEMSGGDGFDCDFAPISPVLFTTSQNGRLLRIEATTATSQQPQVSTFYDEELEPCGEDGCGEFYTAIEFQEITNAEDPINGVYYYADEPITAGDTVNYLSNTAAYPLRAAVPVNLGVGDSVLMPDPVQSQMAFARSDEIFITRDATRFGITPTWYKVSGGNESYPSQNNSPVYEMVFSDDGNHLFFGNNDGQIFRISNLNYAFDDPTGDIRNPSCVLTCTRIANGLQGNVNGIAIDPNNNDHMIVTMSGYTNSNSVVRITNALTAGVDGANDRAINGNLDLIPIFDPEIDVSNGDIVIIGTEYGIYSIDNAFSNNNPNQFEWNEENWGLGKFPVYEVKQQQSKTAYNIETGQIVPALNYKNYYCASHGGGLFKTESLVGVNDIVDGRKDDNKSSVIVYPNPIQINTKLEFNLENNSRSIVKIYNLSGQMVNEIDLGNLSSGKQIVDLQTGKLKAGTYLVNLQAGDLNEVVKIVKSE